MLLLGHAFLWKHGIEHSDPSLWNVMYHPIRKCGVLTDFDLSIIAWRTRVLGTDRTGTIPFMALELLRKAYWDGKVIRRYHPELEAFIWMLPFVFLAYDNGELDPKNRFIKYWITSDQLTCRKEKFFFFLSITTWLNPYLWWEALSRATNLALLVTGPLLLQCPFSFGFPGSPAPHIRYPQQDTRITLRPGASHTHQRSRNDRQERASRPRRAGHTALDDAIGSQSRFRVGKSE